MRIDPEREPSALTSAHQVKPAQTEPVRAKPDQVALNASEKLNGQLQQAPEVRAEKVARARSLVHDPAYPPADVIRAVSDHLAAKWRQP